MFPIYNYFYFTTSDRLFPLTNDQLSMLSKENDTFFSSAHKVFNSFYEDFIDVPVVCKYGTIFDENLR